MSLVLSPSLAAASPASALAGTTWVASPEQASVLYAPLLQSIGVRHGFSTRVGGFSSGRFASLNLGRNWGDELPTVDRNLGHVAQLSGFSPERLAQVKQVHGSQVLRVESPERAQREADGMVTVHDLVLGVLSADCVSLLLADDEGRVAAAHAGWRGTVSGIATEAVAALATLGADVQRIRAVLGPSIGPCCFEVQDDVASVFVAKDPQVVSQRSGRRYVDLWSYNQKLLMRAGLLPQHISAAPPCTRCDAQHFYSFRRDGANIGQHLAFIVGGSA
jgi:YfiH family protein